MIHLRFILAYFSLFCQLKTPIKLQNDSKKSLSNEAPVKSTLGELGDAVYVPPPVLDVPPDIVVPPTQKLARIIEKTANFISSQGTQMEIIVKTKQANNPMFQFLHFDCVLHPFYRHVLAAVRNGTYTVPPDEESSESMDKEELDRNGHTGKSDSEDDNYLHPSLQAQVVVRPLKHKYIVKIIFLDIVFLVWGRYRIGHPQMKLLLQRILKMYSHPQKLACSLIRLQATWHVMEGIWKR